MDSFAILHIFILGGLALVAANYLLNLRFVQFPPIDVVVNPPPLVSVLIPARNEELRLRPCLATLSDSDYPNIEILVLDDHSTDATSDLVRQRAKGDRRIRLVPALPLAEGWTGKAWACQQLAKEAKGSYLLFVDADTRFSDTTISYALNLAHQRQADLLSLWPFLEAKSWSECLVIPFVHIFIFFYMPHWMPGPLRCLGAANGQFLLFKKDAYWSIGGHEVVRAHLVEDIALARHLRAAGKSVLNLDGTNPGHPIALVRVRMYESFRQVWQGFTKNLYPSFEGNLPVFFFFQGMQILLFFTPFLLLFLQPKNPIAWTEVAIIFALRFALARRFRQSYLGALFHPFGLLLVLAISANSLLQTWRNKLPWKGRAYAHQSLTPLR